MRRITLTRVDMGYQVSGIRYRVSGIRYQVSGTGYRGPTESVIPANAGTLSLTAKYSQY